MTILDQICAYKKKEVLAKKAAFPTALLQQSIHFKRSTYSLAKAIKNAPIGIIAEHKRRSPSKAVINDKIELPEVVSGYKTAGVSGISVLTDTKFFGGSLDDLLLARESVDLPLLRKEFIIDPYQIIEAKAYGADAILLIAACLTEKELLDYAQQATDLGLEVLLEVHNLAELEKSQKATVAMIGVNNRNLKTFEVSLETSKTISVHIPHGVVKISESGISTIDAIHTLKEYGYQGFLMGEHFMKETNPGAAAENFIKSL